MAQLNANGPKRRRLGREDAVVWPPFTWLRDISLGDGTSIRLEMQGL
jgi:hypothetical protein